MKKKKNKGRKKASRGSGEQAGTAIALSSDAAATLVNNRLSKSKRWKNRPDLEGKSVVRDQSEAPEAFAKMAANRHVKTPAECKICQICQGIAKKGSVVTDLKLAKIHKESGSFTKAVLARAKRTQIEGDAYSEMTASYSEFCRRAAEGTIQRRDRLMPYLYLDGSLNTEEEFAKSELCAGFLVHIKERFFFCIEASMPAREVCEYDPFLLRLAAASDRTMRDDANFVHLQRSLFATWVHRVLEPMMVRAMDRTGAGDRGKILQVSDWHVAALSMNREECTPDIVAVFQEMLVRNLSCPVKDIVRKCTTEVSSINHAVPL